MSSKVILLNETITISHDLRNLSGYEYSLQDFATHDSDETVRLYSLHFCELEDLEEIWRKANTLIALINGGLNLYLRNSDRTLNISAECIMDSYLTKTLYYPSINSNIVWENPFDITELQRVLATSTFIPSNHFMVNIISLASNNDDVFDLLLLNSLDRNLTNLYKLYETVEFYFKTELNIKLSDGLVNYGIFKTEIRTFKQTANHGNYNIFQLISYDVRHGRNKNPSNFKKMNIMEAIIFVQKIVSTYIQIKYKI